MPLTKLQSEALRAIAAGRTPDSYIAGGIALNREGPRFSSDIDIFQDSEQRLETAAQADAKALVVLLEEDSDRKESSLKHFISLSIAPPCLCSPLGLSP